MSKPLSFGALILGNHHTDDLKRLVRKCEDWGFEYFWHSDERFYRDVYACLAVCAMATSRIKIGPGVTDPYSRHPALTAMGMATIDELSGGRAVLGIGAGIAGFDEMRIAQPKPAKAVREAIVLFRKLLSGERVTFEGEIVKFYDGILKVPSNPSLPIFIAGKGPLNIRLAGEIADGLIISSCVADASIDHTLELLAEGATKAGRDPSEITLASRVNVAISDDAAVAREAVKPMVASLLISKKPDFSFLEPLGLEMSPELKDLVMGATYGIGSDSTLRVAAKIPDAFADALTVAGTADDVISSICRMARRGVGQLMVYPIPCPGTNSEQVLERLATDVMPIVNATLLGRQ